MSDDIKKSIDSLIGAVSNNDDASASVAFAILLGDGLMDLRRIADAVSKLAGSYGSTDAETYATANLTVGEAEIIEALRRGDISVKTIHRDPNTNPELDGEYPWRVIDGPPNPDVHGSDPIEVWSLDDGRHDKLAMGIIWSGGQFTHWRRSAAWTEWEGMQSSPPINGARLVDIRFRQPSKGDRVPDLLGVRADSVGWLNMGRPTNADVVAWRLHNI